ncbi:MAG: hypothetical protein GKR88_06850 [Flavobacteriaceae bacterium]|nr:MAG: hypothetical protein GKR88_06850 [Flavobacteriaceae bacterium]
MKTLLKLFSFKLLTSLLGLLYSILLVRYFGASRNIEIYFAAQGLVYMVTSLSQGGQLAEVFLPEYHKLNTIRKGLGFEALSVILNRIFLLGTVIIAIIFIFASFFIQLLVPGFSEEDKELSTLIFRILLPYLYLQLFNSFFMIVLNAEKKFGRVEFLSVVNYIINILTILVFYKSLGIWALVLSLLLGKVIEFFFYVYQLYRIEFRHSFKLTIKDFDHKSFFKTMKSTLSYVGATQILSITFTSTISFLPEGTLAIFKYLQNLSNKIKNLFIQPFLTIFFTRYSLLMQNSKSVSYEFKKNMISILNVNIIVIIGSILLGYYGIDFIWGGEKFNEDNVALAYIFLQFNIVAVLIGSIGGIYRKMAISNHLGKKPIFLLGHIATVVSSVLLCIGSPI